MIEINALCLGKIENNNDYVVLDTIKMEVVRLSKMVQNIGNIPTKVTGEEPRDGLKLYNAVCNRNTGEIVYTDGVKEDKHWTLREVGNNLYKIIENGANPMVVGKVADSYLVCTGRITNGCFGIDKSVGEVKVFDAKGMMNLNNKLKDRKIKLLNAKVVQSTKKTSDGKPVIYVQSFAGGIHGLIETGNFKDVGLIEVLLKNIGYIKNKEIKVSDAYNKSMSDALRIATALRNGELKLPEEEFENIASLFVSGMAGSNATSGSVLDSHWLDMILAALRKAGKEVKIDVKPVNSGVNRYTSVESILQSIGKRCASALEEAPKQTGRKMVGKNVNYMTKESLVNGDKNLIMLGVIRLSIEGGVADLCARVVRTDRIKAEVYLIDRRNNETVQSLEFDTGDIDIETLDPTKASQLCKIFKVRFSELAVKALRMG